MAKRRNSRFRRIIGSVSNLANMLGCTGCHESEVSMFNQPQIIVFKIPRWTLSLKRLNLTAILASGLTWSFMKSPYRLTLLICCGLMAVAASFAQDTKYPPQGPYIPTPECRAGDLSFLPLRPCPKDQIDAWRKDIQHWRFERLLRVGYDGSQYQRPDLKWTQSSYIQPQMMVEDRYFYDSATRKYTVDRYLDDLEKRYGGIDSVLIWQIYPNIGIDNRNQYDMLRAMPGGIPGVKQMVADFHRRGVRVLFPVIIWDQGTRDEAKPDWVATAELMAEVGADGINGDTLAGVPRSFRTASDDAGHPLALEPEGAPSSDDGLMWNNLTWSNLQIFRSRLISATMKWLETRHMVNVSDRWNRDKTDDLAIRLVQRSRLRKLGKHLEYLERHHASGCGGPAASGHHGTRAFAFSGEQGLGTTNANAAVWGVRQ